MGGKDREPGATRVGICGSHASPGVLAWEAGSYPPPPHTQLWGGVLRESQPTTKTGGGGRRGGTNLA